MQLNTFESRREPTTMQAGGAAREVLKLSELDDAAVRDIHGMFGLWKEADHCDKDDRYR